ncbi:M24 family metallopeptidase [Mesorhizobium sp. M0482]|uniref:M24 family metallopeptidase n=1 Tax=Mesorhizobium sp. M0482 TaxID=2956948 RepID=UPI00333898D3
MLGAPLCRLAPRQPHLKWSDATYKMGCQTNFEFGAFRHRYACALSRTVFLGEPSARAQRRWTAFLAEVDAIRPGAKCSDVSDAFKRAFESYGVRKEKSPGAVPPSVSTGMVTLASSPTIITLLNLA